MNKFTALLAAAVLSVSATQAQVTKDNYDDLTKKNASTTNIDTVAWVYNGVLTVGLNQGILHNWAAGGELASLNVNGIFNANLIRYNNRMVWANNLDAAYGLFYAYSNSFVPRKTDDRIDLTSKLGYRLKDTSNWYFTGLLNAKTQFTRAYNYDQLGWQQNPTSNFLSPLYITVAPGIEYRKGSQFSLFFSPIAARLTFVDKYYTNQAPEGAFGVKNGNNMRFELGAYVTARYVKDITPNIAFKSRLDLYSNYLAKDNVENGVLIKKDNPGNIDILFDNFISFKFYKYFSMNIGVTAIYDNDVPYLKTFDNGQPKNEPYEPLGYWQIKQFLSFGFNYKF
jgi:hypothetical protein